MTTIATLGDGPGMTRAQLLEAAEHHARLVLIGSKADREMTPITHMIRDDGDHIVLSTPWRDDSEKMMTLKMLRGLMRGGHVIRYMICCEAWMRSATEAEQAAYLHAPQMPHIPPIKDHPDRVEIVVATAVERGGKTTRVWEMKRKDGVCVDLVEITGSAEYRSMWDDLLPTDA